MQTAEFNHEDFEAQRQNEADKTLLVKFYLFSTPDKTATIAEGRPMFKEVEMIDIRVPGQRDGVARPASPRDKARFPDHYTAFKNRTEAPTDGTPLTEWPAISRSFADQLSFLNIKTVEQLAGLNDNAMHQVPGIQNYKQKAKDWLEYTKDESIVGKLRDEITERDSKIEELAGNLETLLARVAELEKPKPSRKKTAE
jgi:hypothetical protein